MDKYMETARGILKKLTAAGAEAASCSLYSGECDEVQAEARTFNLMRSYSSGSITLTAIKNKRESTVSINRFDEASVDAAVKSCMDALAFSSEDEFAGVAEKTENMTFRRGVFEPDMATLTARLVEFSKDASREFPNINFEITGSYNHGRSVYVNTNGVEFADETGSYDVYTGFTAVRDGQTTSFGPGSGLLLDNPDIRIIDAADVRAEMERAMRLLDPKPVKDKFVGTLIAAPSYTRHFFADMMETALADKPVTSGTGRFCQRLGQSVADSRISLGCLPFSKDIVMGERYTGEGYPARDCMIIENGILKSFLLSRHGAAKTGLARGANSGGAMCVATGDTSIEDIIASTERGILISRFSGTYPDASGDLSGVAKNSFYIENGRILYPTVETMISCNIFDMLNTVVAISKETVKDGRSVVPYIAFDGVTVK